MSTPSGESRSSGSKPHSATPVQWLALKEASEFLGVHFTTLRMWADKGEIPVFRTPGGHRRFSLDDLRRFLAERVSHAQSPDDRGLVEVAVVRTRLELERASTQMQRWNYPLEGVAEQERRQRGRQLFSLAVAFVMKPNQREWIADQGRELGREYGREAAVGGVRLAETGRAVQFFRSHLLDAVRSAQMGSVPDVDDLHVERLIDQFLDEILYAVLDGYEAAR